MTAGLDPRCGTPGASFDPMPGYRKDGRPRVRNRFPAQCHACGHALRAGEGVVERSGEKWIAACAEGARR